MKSKVRILYIIGSLRLGGAEKQVAELALGLDKSRYEVEICCLNEAGPLVEGVRQNGVKVAVFDVSLPHGKFNPLSYLHLLRHIFSIRRYIKERKPDIIHGYLFTAYIVGAICGRWAGVPVIIASRRSLGYFKDDKPWRQKLENYVNKKTDYILVNSKAVREDVLRREKNCEGKIRLIYNGVDLKRYRPDGATPEVRREWGLGEAEIVVGSVANLIHYKGHLEILEAAAMLKCDFPNLRFVFAGRDGGMKKAILEKVSALGLEGKIILTGSRMDIEGIMPAFDILLLASHEEGFSNVLLEGMACARPIVATNVGGNAESVVDGESGFIVPPRDPAAIAAALRKLLTDNAIRVRFGRAGRTRVEQYFSRERLIQNMDEFYQEIIQRMRKSVD